MGKDAVKMINIWILKKKLAEKRKILKRTKNKKVMGAVTNSMENIKHQIKKLKEARIARKK